jgi:hypothetical protein
MTETVKVKAPWPQVKKPKKPEPKQPKRLDAKFEEWAKRNNINLKELKVMHDSRR